MSLKNMFATLNAGRRLRFHRNRYEPRRNTPKADRLVAAQLRRSLDGAEPAHPKGHAHWYSHGRARKSDGRKQHIVILEGYLGHAVRPRKMGRVR